MKATTPDASVWESVLWTYAKGLGFMVATSLGIFALFCCFLVSNAGHFSIGDIYIIGDILFLMALVWVLGRRDSETVQSHLRDATLWLLFLMLCGHLIQPVFSLSASKGHPWSWFAMSALAIFPWAFVHFEKKWSEQQPKKSEDESRPAAH